MMLLRTRIRKWMMVICLLGIGLLLPVSAYGQEQNQKQTVRIIIEGIQTGFFIAEEDGQNDLRLVVGYEDVAGNTFFRPPQPSRCDDSIKLKTGDEFLLEEDRLTFDFEMNANEVDQIQIKYQAIEENSEPDQDIPECKALNFSAAGPIRVLWTLKELAEFIKTNFIDDVTYGQGSFMLGEVIGKGVMSDESDGPDSFWEFIFGNRNPRDTPGVLKITYCATLIDSSGTGPTTCSEGGTGPEIVPVQPPVNPPPKPEVLPPPVTCPGYKVQPGDTLFSIATRLNIWAHDLRIANAIPLNPYPPQVTVGQCLEFPLDPYPANPQSFAPTTHATCDYRVQPGDTLSSIASRFGFSAQQLRIANGVHNPNLIYANQCLKFPGWQK